MPSIKPSNGTTTPMGPGIKPAITSTPKSSRGKWASLAIAGIVAALALKSCEEEPVSVVAPPPHTNATPDNQPAATIETTPRRAASPFAEEFYVVTANLPLYQADLETVIGTIERGSCVRRFTLFNDDTVIADGLHIIAQDTTGYNKAGYVAYSDLIVAPKGTTPNNCLGFFVK